MATLPSHQITHKGGIAELAKKYKILAQVAPEIICREVATRTDMDLVMRLKNKSQKIQLYYHKNGEYLLSI